MTLPALDDSAEDSRYKTPAEAKKELVDDRNVWTAALGSRSIEACYAVVGATWAVHGSKALESRPALVALTIAVSYVGLNLGIMYVYISMVDRRISLAGKKEAWQEEFDRRMEPGSAFPWTKKIEDFGEFHQLLKFLCPVAAAIAFVSSLWT